MCKLSRKVTGLPRWEHVTSKILTAVMISCVMFLPGLVDAGEYFGFKPGDHSFDEIKAILRSEGAKFADDYYDENPRFNLRVIKVTEYARFTKIGQLAEAFLFFTPNNKLYSIDIKWRGDKALFETINGILGVKYGEPTLDLSVCNTSYIYSHGSVSITITTANDFTVGLIPISYLYKPALAEVKKRKQSVQDEIKKTNAKKIGSDL